MAEQEVVNDGIDLKCGNIKCNYEWTYTGKQKTYTNCPSCMFKVHLQNCMVAKNE